MATESPAQIAETLQVSAGLVLSGQFDLAAYPHRLLAVTATRGFWFARLAEVLRAAEMLMPAGFELVDTIELRNGDAVCAVLRRR